MELGTSQRYLKGKFSQEILGKVTILMLKMRHNLKITIAQNGEDWGNFDIHATICNL